jgi:Glycyl-tRNA synthetase beta subunit
MTTPALANTLYAMPTETALFAQLAQSVTNDGTLDGASIWLLNMGAKAIDDPRAVLQRPWYLFDLFIWDWEAVAKVWDAFEHHATNEIWPIPTQDALPILARFLCERLPAVWRGDFIHPVAATTKAVALADRIDSLVGMFAAGLKPNGSKDPYAMRRAAKEVLQMVVCPITLGFCRVATLAGELK